jgi:hypothetical protein
MLSQVNLPIFERAELVVTFTQCQAKACGKEVKGRCQLGCNRLLCPEHLGLDRHTLSLPGVLAIWLSDHEDRLPPELVPALRRDCLPALQALLKAWNELPEPSCTDCRIEWLSDTERTRDLLTEHADLLQHEAEQSRLAEAARAERQRNQEWVRLHWTEVVDRFRSTETSVGRTTRPSVTTRGQPLWLVHSVRVQRAYGQSMGDDLWTDVDVPHYVSADNRWFVETLRHKSGRSSPPNEVWGRLYELAVQYGMITEPSL